MRRDDGNDFATDQPAERRADVKNKGFWDWFNSFARVKLDDRPDAFKTMGRTSTFEAMFKYLDAFDRPVRIVETGCVRNLGNVMAGAGWAGDGCSTILFDKYVNVNGGTVQSVDIDPDATASCKKLVSDKVDVHTGDSVEHLKELAKIGGQPIDLLYLDSFDLNLREPLVSEVHHINELRAILPLIAPETLVVIDDSPVRVNDFGVVEVTGKGGLIARYAIEVGADMIFCHYQIGWIGMHKHEWSFEVIKYDEDMKKIVFRARDYFERGKNINAASLYRLVLEITNNPSSSVQRICHGEACLFFARASLASDKLGTAMDWYRKALSVDPRAVDYRLEMATKVFRPLQFLSGGQREALIATKIEPDNKYAWRILGGFEHDLSNLNNTKACYERQLALAPNDPEAMLDMISIALDEPDYELAARMADRVINETDEKGEGYHCLAFIASRQSRHEEAIELYDKALELGVKLPATVHWNKSIALHAIGRYREGWIEHEWRALERTQMALYMPLLRFGKKPLWKNEPPPAKIHVHAEAGAGDNISCVRYLKLMADRGYQVCYETYPDMVALMQRSFPDVTVIRQAVDYPGSIGLRLFDYHQPIGGLPYVFETEIDTVPWFGPYIKADSDLAKKYAEKLPKDKKKIGVCWFSGIRDGLWISKFGNNKSIHFDKIRPLFEPNDNLHFVSLQVGPERSQNNGIIADILPETPDWDDTAALIENLDLVISVDTAVMHLAGAMGKPLWVMAQKDCQSWHLLCERPGASWNTASPWYPSARLFRQHRFNEPNFWDEVVADIVKELRLL